MIYGVLGQVIYIRSCYRLVTIDQSGRLSLHITAPVAPAPTGPLFAYPACCRSSITLGGDTVNSLVNDKSLNSLFYPKPDVNPKNAPDSPLAAGLHVTVP